MDYTLTLTTEQDAALVLATEELNRRRSSQGIPAQGQPLPPLTVAEVLTLRILQGIEPARQRMLTLAEPLEAMLLPLTPAQRVALIQRIPSAAVRQRIVDLLRDR